MSRADETNGEEEKDDDDPLNDEIYFLAHRRFERREKQLRNIERERAQHEKLQLDRILGELRGHDWLRVMGIGSIPDGDKKLYEPKRSFFIKELSALLDKFKEWKEEEKRRRLEKDQMRELEGKEDEDDDDDTPSDQESINTSDVDAWAARQLHQEARRAFAGKRLPTQQRRPSKESARQRTQPPALEPEKPFTSFFAKRSLRDAAFSRQRSRRSNSTILAFGHPVPEISEHEFELPSDILTPAAIQACRRKRRRMKREK